MKKAYLAIGLAIIVLGAGFYLSHSPSKEPDSSNPIKIGAVISLTGPAASFGEYAKNGMELAAQEINDNGGMDGRKVEIIYEDDKTDPVSAVSSFKKLTTIDHANGIIGGLWDFLGQSIQPLALQNKTAYISPSNFRIEGGAELNDQSFAMLTDFDKVLQKTSEYFRQDEVKKIAVVHFKSVFGEEIAKTIGEIAKEQNKGDIINEAYSQIGGNDFKTTIAKLKQGGVDTVFLDMVDVDTVNFLTRSRELNFHPKFITYVGAYDSFKPENSNLLEGITILNWEVSTPEFIKRYQKVYGQEPAKSANRAYDAVYVMAEAIAKSNTDAKVASYIASHKFVTPNGTVEFLPTHEVSSTEVKLMTYKNGKIYEW